MTVHHSPTEAAPAIIRFWFGEVGRDRWFVKDEGLDKEIARRFSGLRDQLLASNAKGWRDTPEHLAAAILLLDQCSRNIFRGSIKAFEADELALELSKLALERDWTAAVPHDWRQFLLMPLMHSEELADQDRSVVEFEKLGDAENLRFAHLHRDQIRRFGRFPGRNQALGRVSTPEERAVIEKGEIF